MAVTQYIGARYVPLFADPAEWNNTRTYEPLTVVLHEGNSYTSKQFVPTGIDIDNGDYWAETGNYNAQVEQYRREVFETRDDVDALDGRVTTLENETIFKSDKITVKELYGQNSMMLVKTYDKNIVVDVAGAADENRIEAFLQNNNVKPLDYVIITHMHEDHAGGYRAVIPFCDENTVWLRGMDCTDENNPYYADAISKINEINAALNAAGIGNMTVPLNKSKIELFNDAAMYFYNTDPNYEETYMTAQKEYDPSLEPTGAGQVSYNNYSMIVRIENEGSSVVFTGDVETAAQRLNKNDMRKCTVMQNPHHWANNMGFWEFFAALNPNVIFYNLSGNRMASQPVITDQGMQNCFTFRYCNQIKNIPIYTNYKTEVDIDIIGGTFTVNKGYFFDCISGNSDVRFRTSARGAFPPARRWFDNPNQILVSKLTDIENWINYIDLKEPIWCTTASAYYRNATFMNEAKTVFSIENDNLDFFITKENGALKISRPNSVGRGQSAYIYSSFNAEDFPDTGCRLLTDATTRTPATFTLETPAGQNTEVTLTSLGVPANLFKNDYVIVRTENNVLIPLMRCTDLVYKGVVSGGDGGSSAQNVYFVTIDNGRIFACYSFDLIGRTKTQHQIAAFINPYCHE